VLTCLTESTSTTQKKYCILIGQWSLANQLLATESENFTCQLTRLIFTEKFTFLINWQFRIVTQRLADWQFRIVNHRLAKLLFRTGTSI